MAFSRQLAVIGILGACFCVAVGCDDDGDKIANAGDAGEGGDDGGGKAGSGGKSTGGSNNTSGNGGTATAGSANDAGAGGEPLGGGGGSAGEGGTVMGGGAGAGGDGGGAGAGAGDGGGAGDGPGPAPAQCSYGCEDSDDCAFSDAPPTHSCDPETKTCLQCKTDTACLPIMSFWVTECETDAACAEWDACIAWEGKGYCAFKADPEDAVASCAGYGSPKTLARFGAQGEVMICAAADARCVDGACGSGCNDEMFGGCGAGKGDTCSLATGQCECTNGSECDSGVCGPDHRCGCETDDDCTIPGRDKCAAGVCVCGSVDSCPSPFVGATPVCE
jgi:hypothetical protein